MARLGAYDVAPQNLKQRHEGQVQVRTIVMYLATEHARGKERALLSGSH